MTDEGDFQLTPLSWQVRADESGATVEFRGGIDENVDLASLGEELEGDVVFDLGEVFYINSCGVREWVTLMRSLPRVRRLVFARCSPAIVAQLNLVFNFRGDAEVRSVFVPYYCRSCHHEHSCLYEIDHSSVPDLTTALPRVECALCGAEMECDELPERYFAFLLVS